MRKILLVLSEWGYWGEELIGPLEVFDEKGYEFDRLHADGSAAARAFAQHERRLCRSAARALRDLGGDGREGARDRQSK